MTWLRNRGFDLKKNVPAARTRWGRRPEHAVKLLTRIVTNRFASVKEQLPEQFLTFKGPRRFQHALLNSTEDEARFYFKCDVHKAFDSVRYEVLLKVLKPLIGARQAEVMLSLITRYRILINGEVVSQEQGVLQGDCFSMMALTLVLHDSWAAMIGKDDGTRFWVYVDDVFGYTTALVLAHRIVRCFDGLLRHNAGMLLAPPKTKFQAKNYGSFEILGLTLRNRTFTWPRPHKWLNKLLKVTVVEDFLKLNRRLAAHLRYYVGPGLAAWKQDCERLDRAIANKFTALVCSAANRPIPLHRCIPYRILLEFGVTLPTLAMAQAYQRYGLEATPSEKNLTWDRMGTVHRRWCDQTTKDVKKSCKALWERPLDLKPFATLHKSCVRHRIGFRTFAKELCNRLRL